jgi:DNA repair protein RadC
MTGDRVIQRALKILAERMRTGDVLSSPAAVRDYLATELGYFVEVAVSVQGVTLSQIHPVLDAKNRPIAMPTTFDVNTSIQRALGQGDSLARARSLRVRRRRLARRRSR